MNILHVESSHGFGGEEEWILRLSKALQNRGHGVLIACPDRSPIAQRAQEMGIRHAHLEVRNSVDLRATLRLLGLIWQERADIVHTHNSRTTWAGYYASRLSRLNGSRPVTLRTRHLVYKSRRTFPYRLLSNRIVVVSRYLRDYLVEELGVPGRQVEVIHPGVDIDAFDPAGVDAGARDEFGIPADVPVIGMVAFIRGEKGHRFLVEAAGSVLRVFPKARFLLVGEGRDVDVRPLQGLIAAHGLQEHFILTGYRSDVPRLLAAMDVFVAPSLWEASGMSILEAMAMQKPVVASQVGGIPEFIAHEKTGLLIPPGDPVALADALLCVLSHRAQADKWGETGRRLVVSDYTLHGAVTRTEALYRELQVGGGCGNVSWEDVLP